MDKYYEQFKDATHQLGIEDIKLGDISNSSFVYLSWASGEGITLGRALQSVIGDVKIGCAHISNEGFYEFTGNNLHPIIKPTQSAIFCMREGEESWSNGNSHGFKKYSENKYFSHFILDKNNIPQPKQLMFRDIPNTGSLERTQKRFIELKSFLENVGEDKQIVAKPYNGQCGNNVYFFTIDEILELENFICTDLDVNEQINSVKNEHLRHAIVFGNILIQERIKSYPIKIAGQKKDWNLRVLTTYNHKTKKYIVSGMPGRIDNDGGAINRSISAENISFEAIGELAGWDKRTFEEVKNKIEKLAIETTNTMASIGERKISDTEKDEANFQNLAGIDIIVDENLEPHVIEINDSNSGCVYELMILEGIESVKSIAESVKAKINYFQNIDEIGRLLKPLVRSSVNISKIIEQLKLCRDVMEEDTIQVVKSLIQDSKDDKDGDNGLTLENILNSNNLDRMLEGGNLYEIINTLMLQKMLGAEEFRKMSESLKEEDA